MKNGRADLRPKAENPFLQERHVFLLPSVPLKPDPSRADLIHRLKTSLTKMLTGSAAARTSRSAPMRFSDTRSSTSENSACHRRGERWSD